MPARSTTSPDAPALSKFVVTASAVTMTTGRKANGKPEVTRLLKGTVINAPADHPSIQGFLASKTIAPYDGKTPVRPATARVVLRAQGAPSDPALTPRTDVQPLPASGRDLAQESGAILAQ